MITLRNERTQSCGPRSSRTASEQLRSALQRPTRPSVDRQNSNNSIGKADFTTPVHGRHHHYSCVSCCVCVCVGASYAVWRR